MSKPVKRWCIVNGNGDLVSPAYGTRVAVIENWTGRRNDTKEYADAWRWWKRAGCRCVKVEVREVWDD